MGATSGRPKEPGSPARRWLFADALLDERSQILTVKGQVQALDPKPMEVLLHLLNHAGELVTKDELLAAVWPGRILSDAGLTSCVARLRAALGDDAQGLIKTVHGYGYRLVAPVRVEASTAPPPPRFDFKPGDRPAGHANWTLAERLGTGGHGEVWLARQDKTGEPRIFKYALEPEALPSLKREITLSRYLHDTLGDDAPFVRVLDWNLDAAPFCIQAEYTQGGDLVRWAEVQGGIAQVAAAARLDIAIQIAEALAAAHSVGVLHKDLKPSNVLIDTKGATPRVRLSDFGSGGVLDPGRLDALGITRMGLTMTHGVSATSGTPIYLAPELIAEQPATVQTDIYAMGVLLYQLVVADLKRPLAPGWEHDVEDPLLREDIAAAAAGKPERRLKDCAGLVSRLKSLGHRRAASLAGAPTNAERRVRFAWALAGISAVAAALAIYGFQQRAGRGSAAIEPYHLAAIPFAAAAGTQDFADGWYEELLDRLATSNEMRIAPTALAKTYKGKEKVSDLQAVARELNAETVLIGKVDRDGDGLSVQLQLVRADGEEVWSQTHARTFAELFSVEDRVLLDLVEALAPVSDSGRTALGDRGTKDVVAYDLFLQAKGSRAKLLEPAGVDRNIERLQQALVIDPDFARAYAALAGAYHTKVYWHAPADRESLRKGFAAAERALELRPDLAEAHVVKGGLGMTPLNGFDFTLAIREGKRALASGHPGGRGILGMAYMHIGLFEESEALEAEMRDPADKTQAMIHGANLIWAGMPQQGLDILERLSPREVNLPHLWYWVSAWGLMDLGRNMQAEARLEEFLKNNKDVGGIVTGRRGLLHAVMGDHALAEKDIAAAASFNPLYGHFHHTAYEIGTTYAVMNRPAEAVKWLTQAVNSGFPNYPIFARDPNLNRIREDPEFRRLMDSLRVRFEAYRTLATAPPD